MDQRLIVKKGMTSEPDTDRAIAELAEAIHHPEASVVIFFCSSSYDLERLGPQVAERFAGQTVIGCTDAGELIGGAGYRDHGMVGASLVSPQLRAHPRFIGNLSDFSDAEAADIAAELRERLELSDGLDESRQFGLLLIDGLSMREEAVAASLYDRLGGVPLLGGSAGDDMQLEHTAVYHDGRFHEDAAVFTLFESDLPFEVFRQQHFVPTETKLVITDADPTRRRVYEIDGMPAAEAYAEALGVPVDELGSELYAANPVMIRVGGDWYVRSLQRANEDGSIDFYCAIDTGLVMTVGDGANLVENIREGMASLSGRVPDLGFVLGCDCVFRRMELLHKGEIDAASEALRDVPFLGFSTYGEQFNGLHVNQTLTGVAIGQR